MGDVKILDQERNQPLDDVQKEYVAKMEAIDKEIGELEERIKDLSALYSAHARFLERYSPFGEQGNLSHSSSLIIISSSGTISQSREEGANAENVGSKT